MAARLEADQTLAEAIRVIVNHFDNVNQGTTAELRQTRERLQHSEATSRRIQRIYRERLAVREATIADQQNELEELREENAALEWEAGNHGEVVQQMRRDHERAIARLEAQLAASRAAANMNRQHRRREEAGERGAVRRWPVVRTIATTRGQRVRRAPERYS